LDYFTKNYHFKAADLVITQKKVKITGKLQIVIVRFGFAFGTSAGIICYFQSLVFNAYYLRLITSFLIHQKRLIIVTIMSECFTLLISGHFNVENIEIYSVRRQVRQGLKIMLWHCKIFQRNSHYLE